MDGPVSPGTTAVPPPPAPPAQSPLHDLEQAWPLQAQFATVVLLVITLAVLGFRGLVHSWVFGRPTTLEPAIPLLGPLDVNRATATELARVPGLRSTLVEQIVQQRGNAPFTSIEELRRVPGIGPKTFARIRNWLTLSSDTPVTTVSRRVDFTNAERVPAASSSKKAQALGNKRINVNLASAEELKLLPGIGEKMSQRIIDERTKKPFATVEDLRRVAGVGVKTLEKLRPLVVVEGAPVQLGKK